MSLLSQEFCNASTMTTATAKVYSRLSGAAFGPFRKRGKELINRHWLDTNTHKYHETLERIVIPECANIASDIPGYPERIKKLLSYSNPSFSDAWNFNVELTYRIVADKAHQTEDNITKAYLLRAIMDLLFTMSALFDDIVDGSECRLGKKCWHVIAEGGTAAAIYDAVQMAMLPFFILEKHFVNDPGYIQMMNLIAMGNLKMVIGETLDVLGQGKVAPTLNDYWFISHYKTGKYVSMGPILGLLHAGILSKDLIDKTTGIFTIIGQMVQNWDDFTDYYCTDQDRGKPALDFSNGGTTWVSATAMENFSSSQAEEFKECYGSSDPEKIKKVRKLYDEINMPRLYVEHMTNGYNKCKSMINELPYPKVREAYYSYLHWLVGQD